MKIIISAYQKESPNPWRFLIVASMADMLVQSPSVKRVWIASGCIACGWCTDLLPTVFVVGPGGASVIAATARSDGRSGANRREKSWLKTPLQGADAEFVHFVADGCPPTVITVDE